MGFVKMQQTQSTANITSDSFEEQSMTWTVRGADRDTGRNLTVVIEADSENEAGVLAGRRHNLLIASVRCEAPSPVEVARAPAPRGVEPPTATGDATPPVCVEGIGDYLSGTVIALLKGLMFVIGLIDLASGCFDATKVWAIVTAPSRPSDSSMADAAGSIAQRLLWNSAVDSLSWGILLLAIAVLIPRRGFRARD